MIEVQNHSIHIFVYRLHTAFGIQYSLNISKNFSIQIDIIQTKEWIFVDSHTAIAHKSLFIYVFEWRAEHSLLLFFHSSALDFKFFYSACKQILRIALAYSYVSIPAVGCRFSYKHLFTMNVFNVQFCNKNTFSIKWKYSMEWCWYTIPAIDIFGTEKIFTLTHHALNKFEIIFSLFQNDFCFFRTFMRQFRFPFQMLNVYGN